MFVGQSHAFADARIAPYDTKKNGRLESHPSLAVRRGLEPLTPCVTGTYSNQLN